MRVRLLATALLLCLLPLGFVLLKTDSQLGAFLTPSKAVQDPPDDSELSAVELEAVAETAQNSGLPAVELTLMAGTDQNSLLGESNSIINCRDIRDCLLTSSKLNEPDFPTGEDRRIPTRFSYVCDLMTDAGETIHVARRRAIVGGMSAPRGLGYVNFYSEDFEVLARIKPNHRARPLWCDGSKLYFDGDTGICLIDYGLGPYCSGNVIDVSRGLPNAQLYFEELYGSWQDSSAHESSSLMVVHPSSQASLPVRSISHTTSTASPAPTSSSSPAIVKVTPPELEAHYARLGCDDIRSCLLAVAEQNDPNFPRGNETQLTHFSYVCDLETSVGETIYVTNLRSVVLNPSLLLPMDYIVFFSKDFEYLGKVLNFHHEPLWCNQSKLYLFGDLRLGALTGLGLSSFGLGRGSYGNVIDVSQGFPNFELVLEDAYGSNGGIPYPVRVHPEDYAPAED